MIRNSYYDKKISRFGPIKVGESVLIPVDPTDRPKLGAPNLVGVVIEVNERSQYLIGTRSGRLPHRYERNQLAPCPNEILNVQEVPDTEVTLRVAVGNESVTGKQGIIEFMGF